MQFLIPDDNGLFRFSHGTSTTTKTDILDINPVGVALKSEKSIRLNYLGTDTIIIDPLAGISLYGETLTLYSSGATPVKHMTFDGATNTIDISGTNVIFNTPNFNLNSPNLNINGAGGVRYGGWTTTKLDISGCYLQLENQIIHKADNTVIGTTATISKPYNQYYPVQATGTAYTITLPTITAADLGKDILFRKVRQTGTLVSISFIGNGTQKVYNASNTGGATAQALMTSGVYTVRLLPLPDPLTGAVFAWFLT
jgi:hypothetical protein